MGTVGVVQTFLPYSDFAASAGALDRRRLGKQRVEALQILRALTRERYGWKHHPAVRMWAGYEEALACYAMEICAEWVRRGHADSCAASSRTSDDRFCSDVNASQGPARPLVYGEDALGLMHQCRRVC